ncbi:hypothetical protein HYE67_005053 [Fusarium culmorum]|uniref:NACHT domain-containing protein n=1 Tax=Fusarium culmorum TaxID=5516 RepID=A0A7S8D6D8_FUSCU|nr:hypothetical protein HYE67_005053 [Fusarium culmorum]
MGPDRRFGLSQVYPDAKDHEATAAMKIDIIFMHGLDAQSPKTWLAWEDEDDPASRKVNWLCDKHMLPSSMPHARILTYDWNANYDSTASSDGFLGHADTLLDRIYVNREELSRLQIPLIFVASCFSGLLLAQALVRATERYHPRGQKYRQVVDFTVGVAFLGTPFLGSWDTGYTVADLRVAVAIESGGEYNRELMEYLRQGTAESPGPLDALVQRFAEMIHHEDFKFGQVCFYETRHTNLSAYREKLPKAYAARLDPNGHGIVVARRSACLQGVEGVALDVRHNMLHKFNSPENDGYRRLISRLKSFLEKAQDVLIVNGYGHAYPDTDRLRNDSEERERREQCLQALYFDGIDYEPRKMREPGETACQWLLEDQSYTDWYSSGRGILWILGNPGSGKSTLMKHAIGSSRDTAIGGSTHTVSFFFYNQGSHLQHTTEGLLRALLYQLIKQFPEQTNTLTESFDERKVRNMNGSKWKTAYLMRHLDACLGKVVEHFDLRVFVDALDECRAEEKENDDETQEIRDLIRNLQDVEKRLTASPKKLSICFACRHYPNLARPGVDDHIIAEQNNKVDIEEFAHQELLREIDDEDEDLRKSLEKEIVTSADGNFLWVTLVIARAVAMYRRCQPELLEEVQNIPRGITQIYESTMRKLLKGNSALSLKLFQWVCFALRPLDVSELRTVINIVPDPRYKSIGDIPGPIWGKTDREMEKLICTLSGGLAKVGNSGTVDFIHLSVKDYLLRSGFSILDPTLHTGRDAVKAGHDVLLATCLWSITEGDREEACDRWVTCFTKPIARLALPENRRDPPKNSKVHTLLYDNPLDPGESPRAKVDSMDRSDRHLLEQYLNPNNAQEFRYGYPQNHRQMDYKGEREEWLVIDEMISCRIGLKPLMLTLYFRPPFYCHRNWYDHALQSIEHDSGYAVNKYLDNFLCRAPNSLFVSGLFLHPLAMAARLPDPTVLSGILSRDIDHNLPVNSLSNEGITALMVASEEGHHDNVQVLLQQEGIQVDMKGSHGQTALMFAVGSECKPVVELLIKHNANIDIQDEEGVTALIGCVEEELDDIAKLLLQHGASTDVKDERGLTAFDHAIDQENVHICRHILEQITDTERMDFVGRKRMAEACRNGHTEMVRLFLENGVRTEIPESQAQTTFPFSESALGVAITADQRDILELLLDHEFTHSGLPVWRTNLLCECVISCALECMMSLIIHYGWEIDEVDANGDMPIHVAIREGWVSHETPNPFYDIIKTLISLDWSPQGIVVNALNNQLQSPLMLAVGYCGTERFVQQILADERVNVNYQGPAGTALWCSVARKRHAVTECLLSCPRIDPNLGLRNGVTPLQAAIVHGDSKSAGILLDHKSITVTKEDFQLLTALRTASDEDFLSVLHDFASDTEHLFGYWTVESVDDRRAAIESIQALVENHLPGYYQGISEVPPCCTPDQQEDDMLYSSIDLLKLLLHKRDDGLRRTKESEKGRQHGVKTLPALLAGLAFMFCTYLAIIHTF